MTWYWYDTVRLRNGYEERVTIWDKDSSDEAIDAAEREAAEYASIFDGAEPLGIYQLFELADPLTDGSEVFRLIRQSPLPPDNLY